MALLPITPEVRAALVAALRSDPVARRAAAAAGTSEATARKVAQQEGIALQQGRPRGTTSDQAEAIRQEIVRLSQEGLDASQIAQRLDRHISGVRRVLATVEEKK